MTKLELKSPHFDNKSFEVSAGRVAIGHHDDDNPEIVAIVFPSLDMQPSRFAPAVRDQPMQFVVPHRKEVAKYNIGLESVKWLALMQMQMQMQMHENVSFASINLRPQALR